MEDSHIALTDITSDKSGTFVVGANNVEPIETSVDVNIPTMSLFGVFDGHGGMENDSFNFLF